MNHNISRRHAIGLGLGFAGAAVAGCKLEVPPSPPDPLDQLRLTAVPKAPTQTVTPGQITLDVGTRTALMYVPQGYDPTHPAPVVLTLHGAGGNAQDPINVFKDLADQTGLILVSCKSLQPTWGGIFGDYSDDIPLFDQVMKMAFDMCNIDPARVGIEGFSDGASYALQVGRANGDLFHKVVSFSAGLLLFTTGIQKPKFFIAHGVADAIINVNVGRSIANQLASVYEVTYHEHQGGHEIPQAVAQDAVTFLTT
ncbi:MAG TPA: hypothetical protein VFT29_12750 [Gemmatimonadaceae bacterium]|nr:hypothetical protein [Gemmatimonadaceae bacterium]